RVRCRPGRENREILRDVLAGWDARGIHVRSATTPESARDDRHHRAPYDATGCAADAVTPSRMTPATMSAGDIIKKCEGPSTSVTVEPARSYWKRCRSGATGRSAVPNTAHDGVAFQAAAVTGSSKAVADTGRCEIAMNAASASGRSAQK